MLPYVEIEGKDFVIEVGFLDSDGSGAKLAACHSKLEDAVKLSDLMDDVRAALPEEKRKLVDAVVEKYGADENCRFMLALMATASKRERRLAKLLLSDLEQQEVE